MSKQPGYTRNITQIIQAGGQLRRDMEHSFTIELPNQPGILSGCSAKNELPI